MTKLEIMKARRKEAEQRKIAAKIWQYELLARIREAEIQEAWMNMEREQWNAATPPGLMAHYSGGRNYEESTATRESPIIKRAKTPPEAKRRLLALFRRWADWLRRDSARGLGSVASDGPASEAGRQAASCHDGSSYGADDVAGAVEAGSGALTAEYFPEWRAWWIVRQSGTTTNLMFGPFWEDEIAAAASIHGALICPRAAMLGKCTA